MRKNRRHYDGQAVTTHQLKDVMPAVLNKVTAQFKDRPDLILAAWPEIIGPHFSQMTQAVSFENGVLTVKVKNSSLYALLTKREGQKLLASLRKKFPQAEVKTILFRIG